MHNRLKKIIFNSLIILFYTNIVLATVIPLYDKLEDYTADLADVIKRGTPVMHTRQHNDQSQWRIFLKQDKKNNEIVLVGNAQTGLFAHKILGYRIDNKSGTIMALPPEQAQLEYQYFLDYFKLD